MSNLNVVTQSSSQQLSNETIEKITQCAVHTTLAFLNHIEEQHLKENPEFEEGLEVTPNEHIVNLLLTKTDNELLHILEEDDELPEEEQENPWDICHPFSNTILYAESTPKHKLPSKQLIGKIMKKVQYDNGFFNNKGNKIHIVYNEDFSSYQFFTNISLGTNGGTTSYATDVLQPLMNIMKNLEKLGASNVNLVSYGGDLIDDVYEFTITWMI